MGVKRKATYCKATKRLFGQTEIGDLGVVMEINQDVVPEC